MPLKRQGFEMFEACFSAEASNSRLVDFTCYLDNHKTSPQQKHLESIQQLQPLCVNRWEMCLGCGDQHKETKNGLFRTST